MNLARLSNRRERDALLVLRTREVITTHDHAVMTKLWRMGWATRTTALQPSGEFSRMAFFAITTSGRRALAFAGEG
jgi:hypothetical protein